MGYGYGNGKPESELIVETRSLLSHDSSSSVEAYAVHKPVSLGRQRDLLVRTVSQEHPEAQLASLEAGIATFYSRTQMIVAHYSHCGRERVEEFDSARASWHVPI
jgi:hypothetical protein